MITPGRTSDGRREQSGHGVGPSHLLKDGDEESNLNLCRMLEETVESGCALGLGKSQMAIEMC